MEREADSRWREAERLYRANKKVERNERKSNKEEETFLPRIGPLQNVIMLIRDWLENVKCTKRSTAGYHASPYWSNIFVPLDTPLPLSSRFSLHLSLSRPLSVVRCSELQIFMESS